MEYRPTGIAGAARRAIDRAFAYGLAVVFTLSTVFPAYANPAGGTVSGGAATITTSGTTETITQTSGRAVIDWNSFNIGSSETTRFIQPSSSSLAVNRVNDMNPSQILGTLTANGNIVLINPNGVFFAPGSTVNVNGLIATTSNVSNANVMTGGKLNFTPGGNPNASVVNEGTITAAQAGLVGLVAPNVENSGVITATLGRVQMASGDSFTLDLYGDKLVAFAVSDAVSQQLVENSGVIDAAGGKVLLTAAAGRHIVNSLIDVPGEIHTPAFAQNNGQITIYAAGSNAVHGNVAANKGQKHGTSTVMVSGWLDASGYGSGQTGGSISVLGDNVGILSGALIDASGDAGGGSIKIGGDFHGEGKTPTALNTYVDANALILANANTTGNGGNVAVWSDNNTWFLGNIMAEGGAQSGNGGYVETSGHGTLTAEGNVDLLALNGNKGTYLLDPTNISIYGGVTPAFNSSAGVTDGTQVSLSSNLKLWLDASDTSNVTLSYNTMSTTASGTSGANTITVGSNTGLVVGERIQLGTSTSQPASVNDTSNIYTITNIAGTTITLDANLGSTYSGVTLYGGYVSQLTDKSGNGNNATQATAADMPLWISNGQNGLGVASFNGSSDYLSATSFNPATGGITVSATSYVPSYTGATYDLLSQANGSGTGRTIYELDGSGSSSLLDTFLGGNYTTAAITQNAWGVGMVTASPSGSNNILFTSNGIAGTPGTLSLESATGNFIIGSHKDLSINYFKGGAGEIAIYNTALTTNAQALVNQYQSAKWGIALTGPGNATGESGLTGAEAQAAMASTQAGATTDGYSVFAASYLNRLSQTSNIILQASNNVNLDLQGNTLSLAAGKNITLTAGNQILTDSTGTITTSQSAGSGGNITMNATNGILFNNAFTLNSGGGNIALNNATTLGAALAVNSSGGAVNFASTVNGANNLTVNSGAGTTTFTGAVGSGTGLGAISVTAGGGINLNAVTATSVNLDSSGGSGNIASNNSGIIDATSGTITLNSGGDIDFSNIGMETSNQAVSLTATGNAYLNAINSGTGSLTVNATNVYLYGGGSSLVGYWNFNEGSGTTALDDSGNGNNGTISGATYSSSTPSGTGYSLSFTGNNSYVQIANSASLGLSTSGTIAMWMDVTSSPGTWQSTLWKNTVGANNTTNYGFSSTSSGASNIAGIIGSGSAYIGTPSASLSTNAWTYIVATWNGTNFSLYKNGSLVGSTSQTINAAPNSTYLKIGDTAGGTGFTGLLDDVRIYNNSLSATDIANLYNGTATSVGSWNVGTTSIAATNNINLDLKGDAINLSAGKNMTLAAANAINGTSPGTLGGASANGNITLTANSLSLSTIPTIQTTGTVTFAPYTTSTTIGVAGGAGTLQITGTSGILANTTAGSITIGATGDTGLLTANAYTWTTPVSLISGSGGITLSGAQTMGGNSFFAQTASTGDITIGASGGVTSTATGTPITLVSNHNFINNAGSGALSASSGRWLVYSTNPGNDTIGSLPNGFRRFSCTYGGSCPSFPSTGNGLLYTYTPTLTATPTGGISLTYGDAAPSLSGYGYTITSGYLGSDSGSDSLSGSLTGSTNYTQGSSVGSYQINHSSGSLTSALGYAFSYANNSTGISVGQKAIALTASDQTHTYGFGSLGTSGYSITSGTLYSPDAIGGVTLATSDGTSTSGNYKYTSSPASITPSAAVFSSGSAGNYSITYDNAPTGLTVNKATLTITGFAANNKTYDGLTTATISSNGSLSGVVGSDSVTLSSGSASAAFDNANVGTTHTVTASGYALGSTDAGNYTLTQPTATNVTISARGLTITASDQTQTYGFGSLGTTGFTSSGLQNGETIGGVTLSTNDGTSTSGNYKYTASPATLTPSAATGGSFTASNYSITYDNAPSGLIVNKATLTDSGFAASNKTYDGLTTATISSNGSLSGVVGSDSVSLNSGSASAAFDNANVGTTHTVTASGYALGSTDAGNYTLTQPTATNVTISARGLTITANNQTQTYGFGALGTTGFTSSGLQNGETIGGVTLATNDGTSTSGNYKYTASPATITPSAAVFSSGSAGNYSITYDNAPTGLTVNKAALTISGFAASNKTYDGLTTATISSNGSLSGVVGSDSVTLSSGSASATFDNANVGTTHTVTASGYGLTSGNGNADAGNYTLTQPTASNVTISARGLTITASDQTQTYGFGSLGTTGFTSSGLQNGETIGGVTLSTNDGTSTGGNYKYTASPATLTPSAATGGSFTASNYSITYDNAPSGLIVNKAMLTDSGFAASNKTYDGTTTATISSNGSLSGVVGSDSVTLNSGGASATFDNANVGTTHTVTASGYGLTSGNGNADAGNYSLTQPTATNVTISAATSTTLPDTVIAVQQDPPAIYFGSNSVQTGLTAPDYNAGASSNHFIQLSDDMYLWPAFLQDIMPYFDTPAGTTSQPPAAN